MSSSPPCPSCGAVDHQQAVVYLGGVQRIVCGSCGVTIKTFIRGTDFLLAAIVAGVILFWLIYRP